ncbi:MAG: hypothetical protein AB7Q17_15735 [Phycisphaerae bacterium]
MRTRQTRRPQPAPPPQTDYRDDAGAWFLVLDRARKQRDYERAAEALRELRRLGVVVRFMPPAAAKGGAA